MVENNNNIMMVMLFVFVIVYSVVIYNMYFNTSDTTECFINLPRLPKISFPSLPSLPITSCRDGYIKDGVICKEICQSSYSDDGTICRRNADIYAKLTSLQGCPPDYNDDGPSCRRNADIYKKNLYTLNKFFFVGIYNHQIYYSVYKQNNIDIIICIFF